MTTTFPQATEHAPLMPGAEAVTRTAYSHEAISFGSWVGDQAVREAGF